MTYDEALEFAVRRVGERYHLPAVQLNPSRFPAFTREVSVEMRKILDRKVEIEIAPRTGQVLKHGLVCR